MQRQTNTFKTSQFPAIAADRMGEGNPLLLIHGFPATRTLWRDIALPLAEQFQVIMPDLPGVGESQWNGDRITIEQLAGGLLELLDQLGLQKIVIGGHSMGGYIALAMAALAPEKIAGISLIHSTAMADDDEKKANRRKAIQLIEKGGKAAFINASVSSLFASDFKEGNEAVVARQIEEGIGVNDKTLIAFYNAMMERPPRLDTLQDAPFPVQWIIGGQDAVIPKEKGLQQSSAAGISFVSLYSECGHMSMLEAPAVLAKDLSRFTVYCYNRLLKNQGR